MSYDSVRGARGQIKIEVRKGNVNNRTLEISIGLIFLLFGRSDRREKNR